MIDVTTKKAFTAVLREKAALLFIYAEWSKPSFARSELVEGWEQDTFRQHAPPGTCIYRVEPWGFLHADRWIYAQPKLQFRNTDGHLTCLAASGTMVWLRAGRVVNVAKGFGLDVHDLNRRTLAAFMG
jgi:hypothetical protein